MDDSENTPSENEINEVLDLYNVWLQEEYQRYGDKDKAIDEATDRLEKSQSSKVFFWIAGNDYARIYDVDDTIEE